MFTGSQYYHLKNSLYRGGLCYTLGRLIAAIKLFLQRSFAMGVFSCRETGDVGRHSSSLTPFPGLSGLHIRK